MKVFKDLNLERHDFFQWNKYQPSFGFKPVTCGRGPTVPTHTCVHLSHATNDVPTWLLFAPQTLKRHLTPRHPVDDRSLTLHAIWGYILIKIYIYIDR